METLRPLTDPDTVRVIIAGMHRRSVVYDGSDMLNFYLSIYGRFLIPTREVKVLCGHCGVALK